MTEATGTELANETIYHLLANHRRRFVIHALKREDGSVTFSELSACVAAWELGMDPNQVPKDKQRSVHTTLRRTHLPKLERNDIVNVDEERNVVEPTSNLDDIEVYLRIARGRRVPWSLYYIGVCVIALAVVLAVRFDAPGFAGLSYLQLAVLVTGAFVGVSLTHYLYSQKNRLGAGNRPPEARYTD